MLANQKDGDIVIDVAANSDTPRTTVGLGMAWSGTAWLGVARLGGVREAFR